jgi:putative SOS response-associated peptidase YedK
MCGRYTLHSSAEEVANHFDAKLSDEDHEFFEPSYNIAPGSTRPVVLLGNQQQRTIGGMRWGLIPSWAEDEQTGYKMINARAESIDEKKSFNGPFQSQRCIVPANGFYEWKSDKKEKQPFYIRVLTHDIIGFAGLYEKWESKEGELIYSFTIITTEANALVKPLHDRMPVVLQPNHYSTWLDPENNEQPEVLKNLLQPYPFEEMATFRVTEEVNTPKNDRPELIQPIPK